MKRKLFFLILIFTALNLIATKVVLITDPPFSSENIDGDIANYLMSNIINNLNLEYKFEYVSHKNAMQMIDDNIDAVFFPYKKNRLISNRILVSDTLYVSTHSVFYDSRVIDLLKVESFRDLKDFVIGSYGNYSHEIDLRRAGLTVHYSHDNIESMEKLINGNFQIVTEEKIQGLLIIKDLKNQNKKFISYKDTKLFPEPFFVIAPANNELASALLQDINDLIRDKTFLDNLISDFEMSLKDFEADALEMIQKSKIKRNK